MDVHGGFCGNDDEVSEVGGMTLVTRACPLALSTTREDGTMASTQKRAEDVGVNDLGDGGAVMRALRRSQPWEVEAGGPAGAGLVLVAAATS